MKAGYYIDSYGDIAVRYPIGSWHIMNGRFSLNPRAFKFGLTGIWFIDTKSRDMQAKAEKWTFLGDL